ncbi:MAG: hypothetical protein WA945_09260 [Arcobacteraceae bacterium]
MGAVALYATYDDDITEHYMENNLFDSNIDERLRKINNLTMYVTALAVSDDTNIKKGQRLATNLAGSAVARGTTTALNKIIKKDIPSGDDDYAIGSHHALDPFARSALTRRNVSDMSAPLWLKYSINSLSYVSASGSAFTRVQEGGHSFADQLVSVSIGNFIGLFFYELFLVDASNLQSIHTSFIDEKAVLSTTWSF